MLSSSSNNASEFVADDAAFSSESLPTSLSPSKLAAQLYRIPADDRLQLLPIIDPMQMQGLGPKEHPRGSFGPFPMRTNYDKLLYGTGIAYVTG